MTPLPRYTPPSWPEVLEMANEAVVAATPTGALPLGSEADGAVVALAAAARCRRLLMSVITLTEAGLHDVTGGLLRSIYETWLVGMYAIFGDQAAIRRLLAQAADQERRIAHAVGLPTNDLPNGKKFPTIDLAAEVTKLLEAEGQANAAFARLGYDAIYRPESHVNTHGGLGSILGHVAEDETSRHVLDVRPEDDALARHRLLVGVSLLVSAAQIPARRASLPHDRLDQLAQRIMDLNPDRT